MTNKIFKLGYWCYVAARQTTRTLRIEKPLRRYLGPIAGRIAYRVATDSGKPFVIRGHTMFLSERRQYPPLALATDRYETETTSLFESLVKPGAGVLDIGAHVGYFSLLAARGTGSTGKVYAFEPEPQNYQLLLRNIGSNGYTNVVATQKAVCDKIGSTTLFLTSLDNGRHSTYQHDLPKTGSVTVETTTLDDFLAVKGWPRIDLAKVDVEGAEMDVLGGMGLLLDNSPDLKLIVEFSPSLLVNAGVTPQQFLEELASKGFEIARISDSEGPLLLPNAAWPSLVDELLKSKSSVNLYCTRP